MGKRQTFIVNGMRSRSPTAAEKRRPKGEQYRDKNGLSFSEYHHWLPPRVRDWPTPPIVKCDEGGEQAAFHDEFRSCWWCGVKQEYDFWTPGAVFTKVELHHLAAGSRGRSHERFLFVMLCSLCHERHVGEADLGRLLYLKWMYDPFGTDWVRTAIRLRRFLPELRP